MSVDDVDVERIFTLRASVMRSSFNAMKMVLEEILSGVEEDRVARGWKVFLVLLRMLLHPCPGAGIISREKLVARFEGRRSRPAAFVMRKLHSAGGDSAGEELMTSSCERHVLTDWCKWES